MRRNLAACVAVVVRPGFFADDCGQVVPMLVRGLPLPVLVAIRPIAPGQQLLRDYGAAWWRQQGFADSWEVMEAFGNACDAGDDVS